MGVDDEELSSEQVQCTAIDADWGDDRPNMLMHPPCECPRCAPEQVAVDDRSWLRASGQGQPQRVEAAELGALGKQYLG